MSTDTYAIEAIKQHEFPLVLDLWKRNTKRGLAHIDLRRQVVLVVRDVYSALLGFALLTPARRDVMRLDALLVDKLVSDKDEVREMLIEQSNEVCLARQMRLTVELGEDNQKLRDLYGRFGFGEVGRRVVMERSA